MVPSFNKNRTVPYSLKRDTEALKTIFFLGALDVQEEAYLQNSFTRIEMRATGSENAKGNKELEPEIKINLADRVLETVRLGLKGVENFGGPPLVFEEKQYPFGSRRVLAMESLNYMKPYISELSDAIMNENTFDEEAQKNLTPLLPTS